MKTYADPKHSTKGSTQLELRLGIDNRGFDVSLGIRFGPTNSGFDVSLGIRFEPTNSGFDVSLLESLDINISLHMLRSHHRPRQLLLSTVDKNPYI